MYVDKLGFSELLGKVSLPWDYVLFKKRTKNFLISFAVKFRANCVNELTREDFFCILTGAEKIYNLLLQIIDICYAYGYNAV
jgi:hypothetical protein